MFKHQNTTLKKEKIDLIDNFTNPKSKRQRQYEAIRAIAVEHRSVEETAEKCQYKRSTIYFLIRDVKAGRTELFLAVKRGLGKNGLL